MSNPILEYFIHFLQDTIWQQPPSSLVSLRHNLAFQGVSRIIPGKLLQYQSKFQCMLSQRYHALICTYYSWFLYNYNGILADCCLFWFSNPFLKYHCSNLYCITVCILTLLPNFLEYFKIIGSYVPKNLIPLFSICRKTISSIILRRKYDDKLYLLNNCRIL